MANKRPLVSGPRPGGQEEGRAGEDQEPEEEVQRENPGEHSETEKWTAEEETDEEKTKETEKGRTGDIVKLLWFDSCIYNFYYCAISNIFIFVSICK